MAANPTRTYQVSLDQVASFRSGLAGAGINIPAGNSGQFETQGVTIGYDYDGKSSLTITIIAEPFYVPTSMIWSDIEKYLPIQP